MMITYKYKSIDHLPRVKYGRSNVVALLVARVLISQLKTQPFATALRERGQNHPIGNAVPSSSTSVRTVSDPSHKCVCAACVHVYIFTRNACARVRINFNSICLITGQFPVVGHGASANTDSDGDACWCAAERVDICSNTH